MASPCKPEIGIATGLVVVGDIIGTGAAREETIVGETPNLAARLQTLAEPDMVLVSEATRHLAGRRFEYENRGEHPLKGFAKPMRGLAGLTGSASRQPFCGGALERARSLHRPNPGNGAAA